jgi:HSP20 family molecular chaperone IbpA
MDPSVVEADKISASYNSGVLEIQVPKKVQPRMQQPRMQQPRGYSNYPFGYW